MKDVIKDDKISKEFRIPKYFFTVNQFQSLYLGSVWFLSIYNNYYELVRALIVDNSIFSPGLLWEHFYVLIFATYWILTVVQINQSEDSMEFARFSIFQGHILLY